MRRRDFIKLFGQAAIVLPLGVEAQHGEKIPRVGVIMQGGQHHAGISGLRRGLSALGLEEGRLITIVVRDTKGDLNAAGSAAAELERDGVAILVSFGTSPTLATKRATSTVPMVYVGGIDPVAGGLAESVAKPGGRITGVWHPVADLTGKRLEIFKQLVPTLQRAVTFYNPTIPAVVQSVVTTRDAARLLGIELIERQVTSPEEVRQQADALETAIADGFFFIGDTTIGGQDQVIIDAANRKRMPTMASDGDRVVRGALAAYGTDFHELGRLTARFVSLILAGARPGDLPIEIISRPTLKINLKTAKAIGLEVPPAILTRADEVIE
jgi:putative tryptophan/tyrosine transport system substrate-binding protein